MKSKFFLRNLLLLLILSFNIGCDQLTKSIARKELSEQDHIKLVYNRLTLTKVENSGAFLSFGDSFPEEVKFVFLSLLPLLVLVFGVYFLLTKSNLAKTYAIGLCFVIGGGAGNLYDRILHGSVTDFLHLDFGIFQTGVFNMADVSIMIGMFMLFFEIYWKRNQKENDLLEKELEAGNV